MNRTKFYLFINDVSGLSPITLNLGPSGVSIENPPMGQFKPMNGAPSYFLTRCVSTIDSSGDRVISAIGNTKHTVIWKVVLDGRHNILTYARLLKPGDLVTLRAWKTYSDTAVITSDIRYNFTGKVISLPSIVPLGLTATGEKEMYKISIEVQ